MSRRTCPPCHASLGWRSTRLDGVRVGSHYYGIGDPAKLVCVDIATGMTAWSDDSLSFPDPKRAMAAFIVMGNSHIGKTKSIQDSSSNSDTCIRFKYDTAIGLELLDRL